MRSWRARLSSSGFLPAKSARVQRAVVPNQEDPIDTIGEIGRVLGACSALFENRCPRDPTPKPALKYYEAPAPEWMARK